MTALRSILAASDLSPAACGAAMRAAGIAATTGARLTVLHVINHGGLALLRVLMSQHGQDYERSLVSSARSALADLCARAERTHGVSARMEVIEGVPAEEITTLAAAVDADLLVFGARGETSLARLLVGSTADRLLRGATRSMLVVREPSDKPYRRALVAVDGSEWSAPSIELARAVAPQADTMLLTAYEVPFEGKLRFAGAPDQEVQHYRAAARHESLRSLHGACVSAGLDPAGTRMLALHGDPRSVILDQVEASASDLIVLGKHGCSALEELLLGSVTRFVLARARCDVLVSARRAAASVGEDLHRGATHE